MAKDNISKTRIFLILIMMILAAQLFLAGLQETVIEFGDENSLSPTQSCFFGAALLIICVWLLAGREGLQNMMRRL